MFAALTVIVVLIAAVLGAVLLLVVTKTLVQTVRFGRPRRPQLPMQILVAGGGYVGMHAALRLQRLMHRREATITVVEPRPTMTYQPFLAEAAAGSIEPRHIVVPLRRVLRRCRVVTGRIGAIDHQRRTVNVYPTEGPAFDLGYEAIVIGLGSVTRTMPIPGLADVGFGFKQVEEAIALRNHVLERIDVASSTRDNGRRIRALTFVVVGGGYAGVEALAELEDMARAACRDYDEIDPAEMRWVLVEAAGRILPEVSASLGRYTVDRLRERGIAVLLETRLLSCVDGHVELTDGQRFETDTVVWTAGVRANPALLATDLPLDGSGRVVTDATLAVQHVENAWAAGDNAAVPDLTRPGRTCSPSAQHAGRQARALADNIVRTQRGRTARPYRHRNAGSVASLGLHRGVAEIYGIRLRGFPAWVMHRTYHVSRMPTLNRKVRIVLDWTLALLFRREIVSLGRLHAPRDEFRRAANVRTPAPESREMAPASVAPSQATVEPAPHPSRDSAAQIHMGSRSN